MLDPGWGYMASSTAQEILQIPPNRPKKPQPKDIVKLQLQVLESWIGAGNAG